MKINIKEEARKATKKIEAKTKKEYSTRQLKARVKDLEKRVDFLEKLNNTLLEQLNSFIYG